MMRQILSNLHRVTDRDFVRNQCNKRLLGGIYYEYFSSLDGIDVMDEEWDTLLVLDACRYDTFVEAKPDSWPSVSPVTSRAPNTWEFYQRNFTDGPYPETVVVTANPRTVELRGGEFHDVLKAYEFGWDEESGTVPPWTMAEATIEAHETYPNKRVLSHWIQPHYPFIGSSAVEEYRFDTESIWADVNRGVVSPEDVYEAYTETLELTLPYVEDVFSKVEGRIVLTSDHGNAFGERPWFYPLKIYGHPRSVHLPCLVTVPWLVVDDGSRREIDAGESRQVDVGDSARERLEDLGYVG